MMVTPLRNSGFEVVTAVDGDEVGLDGVEVDRDAGGGEPGGELAGALMVIG